jgi:hypothetical protein
MKAGSDRMVMVGVAVVALLAALWFLAISPKRAQVAELDDEIATLEASVSDQQALIAAGGAAKKNYAKDYQELVVLGKAVPADADAASLIDQTQEIADRAGVDFRGIVLGAGGDAAAAAGAPAAATPPTVPTPAEATEGVPAATDGGTTDPAAATEATASLLPIGAGIGSAGLPVMPYDLTFRGDFFEVADFIAGLDAMVQTKAKGVGVNGRLVTVDGFTLAGDEEKGFPHLQVTMQVTSYVAPADQGLVGGATEETPAAVAPVTPATSPTPTATATP